MEEELFGTQSNAGPSGINFDRSFPTAPICLSMYSMLNLEIEINFWGENYGLFRYEDIPVEATGSDVPAAIDSFADVSSVQQI